MNQWHFHNPVMLEESYIYMLFFLISFYISFDDGGDSRDKFVSCCFIGILPTWEIVHVLCFKRGVAVHIQHYHKELCLHSGP